MCQTKPNITFFSIYFKPRVEVLCSTSTLRETAKKIELSPIVLSLPTNHNFLYIYFLFKVVNELQYIPLSVAAGSSSQHSSVPTPMLNQDQQQPIAADKQPPVSLPQQPLPPQPQPVPLNTLPDHILKQE